MNEMTTQAVEIIEAAAPVVKTTGKFGAKMTKLLGRTSLFLKAKSPQILLVTGIIGIGGTVVLACKATLKADETMERAADKFERIKKAKEISDEKDYSEADYKKDMTVAYVQTAVDFVLLYGPAVALGVASIGCFIGSHRILTKRNVALTAAYKTLMEGFAAYRRRVIDEYGADKDYMFRHNLREETVMEEEVDDKGKVKKVAKKVLVLNDTDAKNRYSIHFDSSCSAWGPQPEYNIMYLKQQERYCNNVLMTRGHLFLNEVYDVLGHEHTLDGQLTGWVLGNGDDYVDFGLTVPEGYKGPYGGEVMLEFNVDGPIYDIFQKPRRA